uniref:Uncharacterized protein n=1 Tax=Anguilla anguilla TaxID=7936 RepID=A0A0E9SRR7_ANGAN
MEYRALEIENQPCSMSEFNRSLFSSSSSNWSMKRRRHSSKRCEASFICTPILQLR